MPFTSIRNRNSEPFTLPAPYGKVLGQGEGIVIPDSLTNVLSYFGNPTRTLVDLEALQDNYSGPTGSTFALAPLARERVGTFTRENIAASLTDSAIKTATDGAAVFNSQIVDRAGSIVGIWFSLSGAAAGSDITIKASINGVASIVAIVNIAIAGTQGFATFNRGAVSFAAGAALGMMITTPAGWTGTTLDGIGGLIIDA